MAWTSVETQTLLALVARGQSNREIASTLLRSEQAVGYRLNTLGIFRRPRRARPDPARFWAKVRTGAPDECWIWQGATFSDGYPMFALWPRVVRGTHFAYEDRVGPIPEGRILLHKCDVPLCVNPAHLEPGTTADNNRDMVAKRRHARGERHGMAKYTAAQILAVKAMLAAGHSRPEIVETTGVRRDTVGTVARGRQWKEVVRK